MTCAEAASAVEVYTPDGRDELEGRICALYTQGNSVLACAKAVGRSDTFVKAALRKHGIKLRERLKRVDVNIDWMVALYNQDVSMADIASFLGCSPPAVERRLAMAGVQKRSQSKAIKLSVPTRKRRASSSRIDNLDPELFACCYRRVGSIDRVAEELGETKAVVSRMLKKCGVVLKRGGRPKHVIPDEAVVNICMRRAAGESWSRATYQSGVPLDAGRKAALRRGPALMAQRARKAG